MSPAGTLAGLLTGVLLLSLLVVGPVAVGRIGQTAPASAAGVSLARSDEAASPVWLGAVAGPRESVGPGWQRRYADGMLYYSPASGVAALRNGEILSGFREQGGPLGALGFPRVDEVPFVSATGQPGRIGTFQYGHVVTSEAHGTHLITGSALAAYQRLGGGGGVLGLPTAAEAAVAGGRAAHFARGTVFVVDGAGTFVLLDPLRRGYLDGGGPDGPLGPPVADPRETEDGLRADFRSGALVVDPDTGEVGPPPPPAPKPATSRSGRSAAAAQSMTLTDPGRASRSYYMTPNGNPSRDQARARSLGCTDARSGVPGLRVLAFGGQETPGIRRPGLGEDWQGPHLSYDAASAVARAWIAGFVSCRSGNLAATIALGTNNYQWARQNTGADGGVRWARFVDGVANWSQGAGHRGVTVVGANDLEPSWGPPDLARAWADAYTRTTTRPMIAFASADGCPRAASGTTGGRCNNGWTVADVHHVSTGAGPGFYSVPQIYRTDGFMAAQWAAVSAWGAAAGRGPVRFAGVMSQEAACGGRGGCQGIDNSPRQAWTQLRAALDARSSTKSTALPGPTDIDWMR